MANYTLTHTGAQLDDATEKGINTSDYVVEQGTSGIWTYRKWESGVVECWGSRAVSNIAINTATGSMFYATITKQDFPANLFTATPWLTTSINSSYHVMCTQINDTTAANTGTMRVFAPSSMTAGFNVRYYAEGRWK